MHDKYLRKLDIKLVDGEFPNLIEGQIRTPEQVFKIFKDIKDEAQETLIALYLADNLQSKLYSVLSVGNDNTTAVRMKDIFGQGYVVRADYFILIHNHPSGDPEPSEGDKQFILDVDRHAKNAMEMKLLDFMIVGNDAYWSIFEKIEGGDYSLGAVV